MNFDESNEVPSGRPVFNVLLAHLEPGKKSGIPREVYNRSRRRQIPRASEEVRVSTVRARTRFAFLRLRDQDVHLIFGWSLVTCRACAGAWTLVDPVWHCLWEQRTNLFKKITIKRSLLCSELQYTPTLTASRRQSARSSARSACRRYHVWQRTPPASATTLPTSQEGPACPSPRRYGGRCACPFLSCPHRSRRGARLGAALRWAHSDASVACSCLGVGSRVRTRRGSEFLCTHA